MYTLEELIKLQREASKRSSYEGALVISKNSLVGFISSKLECPFNLALLNQAIYIYCRRGYAIKMVLGSKKWNLDASKVPQFLDWFFEEVKTYKNHNRDFMDYLKNHYEIQHQTGIKAFKKNAPKTINNAISLKDL